MKRSVVRWVLCAVNLVSFAWGAGITSSLTVNIKSGEEVFYIIGANVGEIYDAYAYNLPPGLVCDPGGIIHGRVSLTNSTAATASYSSEVYVFGDEGSADDVVVWVVTPIVQASASAWTSPGGVQHIGQAITLGRDGTAAKGVTWSRTIVTAPNGSEFVTTYAGLGSAPFTPSSDLGVYSYQLVVGDSTGAGVVSPPELFTVGQILPSAFSPANPKVGQLVNVSFAILVNQLVSQSTVVLNPALDTLVSSSLTAVYPWQTTSQFRPIARGDGQHWIWMAAQSPSWWGVGAFLSVDKAAPVQLAPALTLSGSATGYRSLVAGDLFATITNPYYSNTVQISGPSLVEFRVAFSNIVLTDGYQLSHGSRVVDAKFLGNNDYTSSMARGTVTVSGPAQPANLTAVPFGASSVELRWSASADATSYSVFRNGVLVGSTTQALFYAQNAAIGAEETYTVTANDGLGRSSPAVAVTTNVLSVFAPGI